MKPKKLDGLEGVRALACFGIVLCHMKGAFFHDSALAAMIERTPLKYIFSGNTPVRIMFILSGFVLCYKYFSTKNTDSLQRDAVKRYFRLALPTAAVTLLVYGMMRLNLLYNAEAAQLTNSQNFLGTFNQFEPELKTALRDGFFGSIFFKSSAYVGPLWTMTVETFGSFLVFAVVAIVKDRRVRYIFYAAFLLIFPAYYNYFILGMLVCDIYTGEEKVNRFLQEHKTITLTLHIAAWCYIGLVSNIDYYKWKGLLFDVSSAVMFLTLLNSGLLDRIWGNKVAAAVGKHGFSIYLLHWPVIESFSSAYLLALTARGYDHKMITLSNILLTMVIVYVLSVCFTKLVVLPANRFSDKIAGKIMGDQPG